MPLNPSAVMCVLKAMNLKLTIDGQEVEFSPGSTVLEAADAAGVYIPRMCHHADLTEVGAVVWAESVYQGDTRITGEEIGVRAEEKAHCNLCMVEVAGQHEPVRACTTQVADGMTVRSDTKEVISRRRQALGKLLADHPHACLTCAQKEGCSRTDCSANVPVDERCCVLLGRCELEKVSAFIGIPADAPKYVPGQRTRLTDDPLFDRDFGLCIGCLRCVRICQKLNGDGVLGAVWKDERSWIGTLAAAGLKESQCRFCGACVEVCPTGALLDKDGVPAVRRDAPLPCAGSCPAGIDVSGYVRCIAEGKDSEALDVIRSRVPFPAILGYICFHPCEDSCRRAELDQPVAICDLKRYVADAADETGTDSAAARPATGKKVAIVGSGPAGLSAAYYLSLQGHKVSLFDRESRPGGMLRYGIPDYRLPADVLDREIGVLEKLGVEFHMNFDLAAEGGLEGLRSREYDAVLVAVGTSASVMLSIEKSEVEGIHPGLEFLKSANMTPRPRIDGRVVVIGGGNVAIDAAMTAMRLGAVSVEMVCLESRDEMPAHKWEIAQAEEEGVVIHHSWGPKRFTSDKGRVSGVELRRCTRVFDDQHRFAPQYNEDESTDVYADMVIVTIGQQVEPETLPDIKGLSRGAANTLVVDEKCRTGVAGVFAAGDVIRGPSSVVDAIADGRKAADAIDRYLGGGGFVEAEPTPIRSVVRGADVAYEQFQRTRHEPETADAMERKAGFDLIRRTLSAEAARSEAGRCLQCYLRQMITPVTLPPELWQPLTEDSVKAAPESEGVIRLLNAEGKVIRIAGTANLRQSLLETLENPGEAVRFGWEEDPMYTKRESELIQQHLQEHGEMPGGGSDDDLDDLF
ncbi:MAG: FAD-dependent oxidoreductase [Candidatus Zixiibacteriota bacterium]|nr:MAG: FAD-dependent oxidoreductase [candidate division Zixibacteria bacterium]